MFRRLFRKTAPDPKVKITAGAHYGDTRVFIEGVDVSERLLAKPFEIHFADGDDNPVTYIVIGLPVSELDIELPDAVINAIAISDEMTGEVA